MFKEDTIAAITTGMSNAGVGIIRISGDRACEITDMLFRAANKNKKAVNMKSYTAAFGGVYEDDRMIDEAILLVMKAPHTYTCEDVCELQCHGGIVVLRKILDLVIKCGARAAEPGEFTKRAFLGGRIDLSQAESVMDIINAKNDFAARTSVEQLQGRLRDKIIDMREQILYNVAFIESALDDPEHYSVDGFSDELKDQVEVIINQLNEFLENADNGRILKEGIQTVIVGKPNAGKSSVLNVLLGEERAIVTDIAGTTRDTLEESIQIKGIPLNIIDTAGIRDTNDLIEKIGVDKAKDLLTKADLVLYVVDTSDPLTKDDEEIMELIEDKQTIVLLNKADLDQVVKVSDLKEKGFEQIVQISAKEQTGIEELYQLIQDIFFEGHVSFNDEIYLTNMRHKTEVSEALKSLAMVLQSIEDGMPEDFFSIDLLDAYEHLGFITGESVGEDLVNEIFAEFCMGK